MNYSKQRECIINNLMNRYDHPTAEDIYLSVREEYPKISLGTVYRNLTQLANNGTIQKISTLDGPERFDYNEKPHLHFVCKCCSSVSDLDMDMDSFINQSSKKQIPGQVDFTSIVFYGTCEECEKLNHREVEFK